MRPQPYVLVFHPHCIILKPSLEPIQWVEVGAWTAGGAGATRPRCESVPPPIGTRPASPRPCGAWSAGPPASPWSAKAPHQDHSHDPAEDRQPAAAVRPWFAVALGRGERARGHRVVRAPVLTRFDGKGKASVACGARAFNRWTSKTRGLEFSLAVWKSRLTWFSSHALFCPTAA